MSPIEAIKAEAIALRLAEKARGRSMKHSEALEQVAKKHGYRNWRACCASLTAPTCGEILPPAEMPAEVMLEMERYISSEWGFALEIPKRWNRFPPVSENSPFEVTRFASNEGGNHLLIIFRWPNNPSDSLKFYADRTQEYLSGKGYGNFVLFETSIGARPVLLMSFDKPQGKGILNCRHYYMTSSTLGYTLGFGTTLKGQMFELFERMAKTFEILPQSPIGPRGEAGDT